MPARRMAVRHDAGGGGDDDILAAGMGNNGASLRRGRRDAFRATMPYLTAHVRLMYGGRP